MRCIMAVFLSANKNSNKTTVSIEEIREFVESAKDLNEGIKNARAELKKALDEDEKIDELKEVAKQARATLKGYIDNHPVYREYTQRIEDLKTEKADLVAEAKSNGVPKKEIDTAIKMLKGDIDPDSTTEIYTNIADLVE